MRESQDCASFAERFTSAPFQQLTRKIMRHDESSKSGKNAHPTKNEKETSAPTAKVEAAESEATPVTTMEAAAAPAEVERLQTERDQLFDRLARLQAEFDNYRKRETKERAEYRDYALINTIEQFLPVLDNFQLALKTNSTAEQLRSGVELIVRQMSDVLRNLGVQPIPTLETQFDPRIHEAIEMVEREDLPDHQVMDEVRRGYTLRERLLRPALVRVATNPKQKTA
jgi:molecular chaperone GrpE